MKTNPSRLFIVLIALSVSVVPTLEARPSATVPLRALFGGKLTLTPSGADAVTIQATMRGVGAPFGPATALATWTTSATRLAGLQTGLVDELTIGNGTLVARTWLGTVAGPFSGKLRRLASGAIVFQSEYVLTSGTGFLALANGPGTMLGLADPATLDFRLYVEGVLTNR